MAKVTAADLRSLRALCDEFTLGVLSVYNRGRNDGFEESMTEDDRIAILRLAEALGNVGGL